MGPLVLSGFMATGKTVVGRTLALRLGVPFVDTDEVIAAQAGRSVPELWQAEGEEAFRARELGVVTELLARYGGKDHGAAPTAVLALGGGAVTRRDLRHRLLDGAFVVTLTAHPSVSAARAGDVSTRPNLRGATGGSAEAVAHRAAFLLEQRADAYAEAHATVATDERTVDDVVDCILAAASRDLQVVALGLRSYVVELVHDAPKTLSDTLASLGPSSVLAVTDAHVLRARGAALAEALGALAVNATTLTLPPGEAHKTLATVSTLWDGALAAGADRDTVVAAFGGGVVGDLAGFAAATLLRGVRFVQVPTTVLAMVDASVGGKTGFDHSVGKNLVGAFHQPSAVVADIGHLATLPARERSAGLAEAVKIGLTHDGVLLDDLEAHGAALAAGDPQGLRRVIRRAVSAKARVVRDDEREAGPRALLNLGHTAGHALEAAGGYRKLLHGEAVAVGMVLEMALAARRGLTPPALVERVTAILRALGLPTTVPAADLRAALPFLATDKKRSGRRLSFPVVASPGDARVERVPFDDTFGATLLAR